MTPAGGDPHGLAGKARGPAGVVAGRDRSRRRPPAGPGLWPTIAAFGLVLACLELGAWQWGKAETLVARQVAQATHRDASAQPLPATVIDDPAAWSYRPVIVHGEFIASGQILLDNQVRDGWPGVSVMTPLRPAGGGAVVLVDRGWLPVADDPRAPLTPPVPGGPQQVRGTAWPVDSRHFTLAADDAPPAGNARWQHLDLARYATASGWSLQPLVIRLDPDAAGGFRREWPRPADRETTHRGYALQWYAFAATAVGLWLLFAVRALVARWPLAGRRREARAKNHARTIGEPARPSGEQP